jgi:putative tryptophan/tyrosine transport system substrate-binding protein
MRRIGVLMGWDESDPEAQSNLAAFVQELQQLGWMDGRNCGSTIVGPMATLIE